MNKKSVLPSLAAVALIAVTSPQAFAIPMTYEVGAGSIIAGNFNGRGLVIKTSLLSGLEAFTLDDGQSKKFKPFKISTDEASVGDDHKEKRTIKTTLNLGVPDKVSLYDQTSGVSGILLQSGKIEWSGPATFTVGGCAFSIALSNEEFNKGLYGLKEGEKNGAYVEATGKQISSSRVCSRVSVPENTSTATLLARL